LTYIKQTGSSNYDKCPHIVVERVASGGPDLPAL